MDHENFIVPGSILPLYAQEERKTFEWPWHRTQASGNESPWRLSHRFVDYVMASRGNSTFESLWRKSRLQRSHHSQRHNWRLDKSFMSTFFVQRLHWSFFGSFQLKATPPSKILLLKFLRTQSQPLNLLFINKLFCSALFLFLSVGVGTLRTTWTQLNHRSRTNSTEKTVTDKNIIQK